MAPSRGQGLAVVQPSRNDRAATARRLEARRGKIHA